MKYTIASTYISGFNKIMPELLKENLNDVKIIENYDGIIIYETENTLKVTTLPFFNNSFLLLSMLKTNANGNYLSSLKQILNEIKLDKTKLLTSIDLKKYKTFKIICTDKNQPTSVDFNVLKPLENKIKDILKLNVGFKKHDLDFVFARRNEGIIMFMLKLTYNRITEKTLQKGSLRPELSYMLSYLAEIKPSDIIIDPFCGTASISKQILKHFKYNMMFLSDNDEEKILKLKNEYKKNNKNLFIKTRDALELSYFEDGFINKIITDPPWNEYNKKNESFVGFYEKMLREFNRILSLNGTAIVLMGNIKEFEIALNNTNLFKTQEKYNILVNGKKANVYKLIKNQHARKKVIYFI